MYLSQDLNRCPLTINGYRTAIVDTLGPAGHHIAQSSDLHRLLSIFHRDRPKSSRNLPKCNLSVVLNELTKAPFEPMKDTDLEHLTSKTALGVSVDQIMQTCHWKTRNTFTNFYLKDLTWSDSDNNMYLGPVVAAQVLNPSPQTSHPQKERKEGGHIRYSQVFRSQIPGSGYKFTFQDITGKVILYF